MLRFFHLHEVAPGSVDQELYERVYNRYVKIYPEAGEPDFEPSFSGHDSDWDRIWHQEEILYEQEKYNDGTSEKNQSVEGEYEDEEIYGPQAPPKKKKKSTKSKKDKESTSPVENCSSEENPNAENCYFYSFLCDIDDGAGTAESVKSIKMYDEQGARIHHGIIGLACGNSVDVYTLTFSIARAKGPCDDHQERVFFVNGKNHRIISESNTRLTIEVFSSHKNDPGSLSDLALGHSSESLSVVIDQCGSYEEILIAIFPRYVIDLDLAIEFENKKTNDVGWDRPKGKYGDGPAGKKVEIPTDHTKETPYKKKISLTKGFNGNKQNWGAEFGEGKLKNFDKLVTVLDDYFTFINAWFSTFAQLTVVMPKVSGKGSWSYLTTEDFSIKKSGSYTASCSPLIGFTFEMSLIKSGIIGGPALGKALQLAAKVKEWTEGHVDISFDITVSIGGDISMEFQQSFEKGTPLSSKITSSVQLILKAYASFGVDAYILKIKAEASGNATVKFSMGISLTSLYLPKGEWSTDFVGLVVALDAAYEVGIGWISYAANVNANYTVVGPRKLFSKSFDLN